MKIFSDEQPVGRVSATQLGKSVSSVLNRVSAGERIVVSRNNRDVALLVSLEAGVELMLAGSERFAAMRREAREELEAGLAETLKAWRAGIGSS